MEHISVDLTKMFQGTLEKDLMENKISVNEYEKIIKNTEGSLSINLPLPDYTKL